MTGLQGCNRRAAGQPEARLPEGRAGLLQDGSSRAAEGCSKTPKSSDGAAETRPPPSRQGGGSVGGSGHADRGGTLTLRLCNIFLYLCKKTMKKNVISLVGQSGLTVKNGRLINNLPDGTMGIQAAADARKMRKREEKINMMVEADVRASMREKMLGFED